MRSYLRQDGAAGRIGAIGGGDGGAGVVERRPYTGRQRSGHGRAAPLRREVTERAVTELGGNGSPTRGRTLLDDVTSGSGMGMRILAGATGLGMGSGRNKLTTRSFR